MHRSRVAGIVIDCRAQDLMDATSFWANALGYESVVSRDPLYADLKVPDDQPQILMQKVDHESRVHLDIETDDIEAEVARLEKLGAKRVAPVKEWWVMEAPSGHKFCVVKPQRPDFAEKATVWED